MENVIKAAVERGASDLHIKAGDVFRARIDGELQPLTKQRLTPEQTKAIALQLIPTEDDRRAIDQIKDYDCSWGAPGIGRFRVNIMRQRSSIMVVMRVIPFEAPTFEGLGLPPVFEEICQTERGMIVVTGESGSGKTSTITAMVHHMNTTVNKHIVSLESPIEFLHRDLNSSVTQREIGVDTADFETGLRAALRQDPDVVVIDELRDAGMVDVTLKAAERGHLVISSLPTTGSAITIARLISMFPPGEQEIARLRFADVLQSVISQRLLPRADGHGRCVAVELLTCDNEIRELIQKDRLEKISRAIEQSEDSSMQTMDEHLFELVESGTVALGTALAVAERPAALKKRIEGPTTAKATKGRKKAAKKEGSDANEAGNEGSKKDKGASGKKGTS
jgi:twitching motility protein PilT